MLFLIAFLTHAAVGGVSSVMLVFCPDQTILTYGNKIAKYKIKRENFDVRFWVN